MEEQQQQHHRSRPDDDAPAAAAAILELPPPPLPPARVLRAALERLLVDGGASSPAPPPRVYVLMHGAGRPTGGDDATDDDPESRACTPLLLDELRRLFAATASAGKEGRLATADVVPVLPFAAPPTSPSPPAPFAAGARRVLSLRGDDAARELARAMAVGTTGQQQQQEQPIEVVESAGLVGAAASAAPPSAGAAAAAQKNPPNAAPHTRTQQISYPDVAVGGTFDRLHAGHRLLLAATALAAERRVFAGVTADALLRSKRHGDLLQPYEERAARAEEYMRRVRPGLEVTTGALRDPAEPTQAELDPAMRALVVSRETLQGGEAINTGRAARGFAPLELVVVGLIGGGGGGEEEDDDDDEDVAGKLSSTALREREAAEKQKKR